MQTVTEIRALLEERGLRPKKSLGQNFLIDQNLLGRLVDVSGVGAGDTVLEEIGRASCRERVSFTV